ncbi:MAG: hypothetical protein Q4G25_10920 [Paracoccus sp. (in: a-proteobacteria)]|nr:hypothetical protein [Paracoccus sp. (in: a-proteobacteria)]
MKHAFLLLAVPLLAACAPRPGAPPDMVFLRPGGVLEVFFQDGTVCRDNYTAHGGAGQLAGCPHPLRYVVEELSPGLSNVTRGLTEPHANITLSDGHREWRFLKPDSRNWSARRLKEDEKAREKASSGR